MALTKDFGFGPDEQLVRDQARKFLRENFGIDRLRKLVAADHHDAYESAVQPAPTTPRSGSRWSSSAGPGSPSPKTPVASA
jgi:hypothetical protein